MRKFPGAFWTEINRMIRSVFRLIDQVARTTASALAVQAISQSLIPAPMPPKPLTRNAVGKQFIACF
jgi:RES domain-containing protein